MDIVSDSILKEFSKAHELSGDEAKRFEHLACYLAVGQHCNETFDTADFLVGEAVGIDAVGVIVNGRLYIDLDEFSEVDAKSDLDVTFVFVQADRGASFPSDKILAFGQAVREFFNPKSTIPLTAELQRSKDLTEAVYTRAARFRGNPVCRLYFVTTGSWNPDDAVLANRARNVEDSLKALQLFRDVKFIPLGAAGLQDLYRQRTRALERSFVFDKRVTLPAVPGVKQALLGFLPVPELRKMIADEDGEVIESLFYSNPRDWQEWNAVNTEIKHTLESAAKARFILMNNGITIIAREVKSTGDNFILSDYQIVNGCQTCHALLSECTDDDIGVAVPVRIIETVDETVKNDIIRATNRQTPVTEEQFFALQDFAKDLEAYFEAYDDLKALYYERRSRQYEKTAVEKTRVVSQGNVIRAFAAMFLEEPHRTTRNYAALKAKVGRDIFGRGHRKEPYYTSAYALYKLESLFRRGRLAPKYKPARFHILLATRLIGTGNEALPRTNSNEMAKYCGRLLELLWSSTDCEGLMVKAAEVVESCVAGEFNRDNIRKEPTTTAVISACKHCPKWESIDL